MGENVVVLPVVEELAELGEVETWLVPVIAPVAAV